MSAQLEGLLAGLELLPGWSIEPSEVGAEEWRQLVEVAECRRSLGAGAPLLTVLLGPTGAGKSTIFNALAGRELSAPGAIRPCTSRPLGWASPDVAEAFERDPILTRATLALEWKRDSDTPAALARQALLDTPDFDSVEDENRRRAEALLLRADRILLVLTPEKYGDARVWEIVDRLRPLGSIAGVIFNKTEGDEPLADCRRLLAERSLPAPVVVPRLVDGAPPESFDPRCRDALRALLAVEVEPDTIRAARLRALLDCERHVREARLEPWLADVDRSHRELIRLIEELREDLPARVERELALEMDSALRRELQERFLEQVQRIDILREPRRWLAAPFAWLGRWARGEERPEPATPERTADWLTDLYGDRHHEFLIGIADRLRTAAERAREGSAPPFPWHLTETPDAAISRRALAEVFGRLGDEIARESARIAEGLPLAGKVSFYGSQVVFHTLVASICVHTGGVLSPVELATQGLVSPFVARVIAGVVSSGEAKGVEEQLGRRFAAWVAEAAGPVLEPLVHQLAELRETLPAPSGWRAVMERWRASFPSGGDG